MAFAITIGIDVEMHDQQQHNLDELTLYLYDNYNPLFDNDLQAVDYLHFAHCFGITIYHHGGGTIYFVYAQDERLGQLFLAAADTANHHIIDYMGSTGTIVPYTTSNKE
eukprot:11993897-Ditylum_brightwellii.AAC.1